MYYDLWFLISLRVLNINYNDSVISVKSLERLLCPLFLYKATPVMLLDLAKIKCVEALKLKLIQHFLPCKIFISHLGKVYLNYKEALHFAKVLMCTKHFLKSNSKGIRLGPRRGSSFYLSFVLVSINQRYYVSTHCKHGELRYIGVHMHEQ